MESFRHLARWARDLARNTLLGAAVLENKGCVERKILLNHNERTVVIHAQSGNRKSFLRPIQCYVNAGPYAEKDALAASPLVSKHKTLGRKRCGPNRRPESWRWTYS